MRRFALLVAAGGLVGWGVTAALGGCGGDETADSTPDGATADESSSGASGGTSGDNGTSGGTSGSSGDASSSSSSGNVTSNPGKLTCGAAECDAGGIGIGGGSVCCVRDAGTAPTCSTGQACGNNDLRIECDEPADCAGFGGGTRRCCLRVNNGVARRAECANAGGCGNGGIQLCKTAADCGDAGACNAKKCGDYNAHVCGSPADCQ